MTPSTIGRINLLPHAEKREYYLLLVPDELIDRFYLSPDLIDNQGRDLLKIKCPKGSSSVELKLFHKIDFPDPVAYLHLTDTLSGRIRVLLYIINNPNSPRFNVDRLPDGTPTKFGTKHRNLEAEKAAMEAGLAPGQIRAGLRLFTPSMAAFEKFIQSLHQDIYFLEPLFYHTAVMFERHGFTYEKGARRMGEIHQGFEPGGGLAKRLDGSTPFRSPKAAKSIRLRSWAIHDGILDEPFSEISMYKSVGAHFNIDTTPGVIW